MLTRTTTGFAFSPYNLADYGRQSTETKKTWSNHGYCSRRPDSLFQSNNKDSDMILYPGHKHTFLFYVYSVVMNRPQSRRSIVLAVIGCLISTLSFLFFSQFSPLSPHLNPFSTEDQRVEYYNFRETLEERRCFADINVSSEPIPNVVHFLWGLEHRELNFMNYLAIRSALITHHPATVKLHYQELDFKNYWFNKLRDNITLVHHNASDEYPKQVFEEWQVAHLADALRLDILRREGGIYLDMDVISLQSFDILRYNSRDVILANEGGDRHGLCNAIILARKGASFLSRWIESYTTFAPKKEWNYHSVILPKKLAAHHPSEVCPLAPTVFFWPTYTPSHLEYMHEPISEEEAQEVERLIIAHGGGLNPDQLAYHAWSQVSRELYLDSLTPDIVREKNTRFNVMVRRFLE